MQREAAEYCRRELEGGGGAFLAEPRTRAQLESLGAALRVNKVPGNHIWVGLEDRDGDGAWTWLTDGVKLVFPQCNDGVDSYTHVRNTYRHLWTRTSSPPASPTV